MGVYKQVVTAIIRPPRAKYLEKELGPREFVYGGVAFVRRDLTLPNKRGLQLACSFWHRRELSADDGGAPCVVYCHGNSSSRLEALTVMAGLLQNGFSLFAFDFSGCGQSEGEYISLGWFEQDDVLTAVEFLSQQPVVSVVGLWGRSMGAVSCLLAASRNLPIAALVLDSPFASFKQLALDTGSSVWRMLDWRAIWQSVVEPLHSGRHKQSAEARRAQQRRLYEALEEEDGKEVDEEAMSAASDVTASQPAGEALAEQSDARGSPLLLLRTALLIVATSVRSRAKFNLYKLNPAAAARVCTVPMLIANAANDQIIPPSHATVVFDAYGSSPRVQLRLGWKGVHKVRVVFPGDHNDERPCDFLESATTFLVGVLQAEQQLFLKRDALPRGENGHLEPIYVYFDRLQQDQHSNRSAFLLAACCVSVTLCAFAFIDF